MGTIVKVETTGSQHLIASTAYAVCEDDADAANKVAVMQEGQDLVLTNGLTVHVLFTKGNEVEDPFLDIGGTGILPLYRYGTTPPGVTPQTSWRAGSVITVTFNGDAWIMNGWLNDDENTHYNSNLVVADSATSIANTTEVLTNGNVYLNHVENEQIRNTHKLEGAGPVKVQSDEVGNLSISVDAASKNGPGLMPQYPTTISEDPRYLREDGQWTVPEGGGGGGGLTIDQIYPVGSIYMSTANVNPSTFILNTTWVQLQDTFLLAAGSTYTAGDTGGSATHTPSGTVSQPTFTGTSATTSSVAISSNQMPSHSHQLTASPYADWRNSASQFATEGGSQSQYNATTKSTGGGQGHSHTVTVSGEVSQPTFTGSAMDTMPPYLAVYMWERTA